MSDAFETNEPLDTPEVKFDDLVGEGRKYRDQDAVAKALTEKDRFIAQLQRENAEAREAIQKRINEQSFNDRLERLNARSPDEQQDPPAPQQGREAPAVTVTPETIDKLLDEREAKKKAEANLEVAVHRLKELYGDDYKRHVAKQAQGLGITTADLTALASRSPDAFFRAIGVEANQRQVDAFSAPPRPSVTAPATAGSQKNYQYYSKLRQEKGEAWYFTPQVQNEIWNAVKTLGEAEFYKRN